MSHSISLSRSAALCGGFLPLELLARKLARFQLPQRRTLRICFPASGFPKTCSC